MAREQWDTTKRRADERPLRFLFDDELDALEGILCLGGRDLEHTPPTGPLSRVAYLASLEHRARAAGGTRP